MIYVIYYPVPITGHIAIVLTGLKKNKKDQRTNVHISFYPEIKQSKTLFRLHSFQNDGTDVSQIIAIASEESCGKGLSEKAIYEWWEKEFKPQTTAYGLLNNNCSSYVYRALIEGQDHSETLNKKRLLEKSWFCSPNNVMNYADQLNKLLLKNLTKEQKLFAEFADLKDCRFLGNLSPFDQATVIYSKIKKIPAESDAIMLRKPYRKAIKKVLKEFRRNLFNENLINEIDEETKNKLIAFTHAHELEAFDFENSFERLYHLMLFVYDLSKNGKPQFEKLLQESVKNTLLPHMNRMIDNLIEPNFKNTERINKTMSFLGHKVNDELNPQRDYFLPGTKRDLGWWVRMWVDKSYSVLVETNPKLLRHDPTP